MIQEHVREKEPEDVDKVLETNPANTAVNTAKHEPLGAIAELETPDDDYKETGARNRTEFSRRLIKMPLMRNCLSKKMFQIFSLKTVLRKMKPRNLQPNKHLIIMPWILSQDLVKNPVVPFQDLIDDPEEIKTNKFEVQNNFFDDESKAVHEKHGKDDGHTEEKSNPIVAWAQIH